MRSEAGTISRICRLRSAPRWGEAGLDPEFVALHRAITECRARILYRGPDVAGYSEPKALAQRG